MAMKENKRAALEKQLEAAIAAGDTEAADALTAMLYAEEEQREIEMPVNFPQEVIAAAEKGKKPMEKKKIAKRMVASVAAFALVLSFGVTAYAQGWFQNAVRVLEGENAVVTGENIDENNLQEALDAEGAKEDIYEDTVTTRYPDFVTACEAIGLPSVYPTYLTEHSEFATENGVYTSTNPNLEEKGVYSDYFADGGKGISMSLDYQGTSDDVIAKFDEMMKVENTRSYTTAAGDVYTVFDLTYTDTGESLVEADIEINGYLFNMMFCKVAPEEMEAALDSVDLTPLKVAE